MSDKNYSESYPSSLPESMSETSSNNPDNTHNQHYTIESFKNYKPYQFKATLFNQALFFEISAFDIPHATTKAEKHVKKVFKSQQIKLKMLDESEFIEF